ncbi:hypothetical protein QYE76_026848 [Lolium multiflorum]|uniref:CCHC-type domain-containing protein n=1 Tax=Lolium multiflorum TaxID=4521 RepID=A0AAD8RIH6_LOLMU|nr:hypothetical protein QYE76_026848 [Lolium multiflorum]
MAAAVVTAQNSQQDFLDLHNAARRDVGVEQVIWNNTVAAWAQDYADAHRSGCILGILRGPGHMEYGMEFEVLFGVSDGIQDITRSSGMVRRIRFIYRKSYSKFGNDPVHLWKIMASPSINFNQFLEKEKLKSNGSNFTDWFRHVRIFLNGGNLQYVLEAPLGPPPPPAVCEEEKNVFETRTKVYSQVQCAILCSLEAELQKRFEHHDPCEMIRELKVIFETHAAVESYEASKQFFGCMMEEGSSVSEHVFAMSGHARKLSDLGIVIPNQLGIHRVLQSLPPSYKNFVMNYNMQNMNKELPELFSMLKSAEVEIQKEHQVLMVNKTTKFKKQGKPKKDLKKGGKKAAAHPEKPKGGPKPDTDCYYCNGKGHWKRNCSKYLADLKSGLVKKKKVSWCSSKQCTVAKSSTESEYIAASEASSKAVWMKRFIVELGVVPSALDPLVIYCDNMGAIANAQEPRYEEETSIARGGEEQLDVKMDVKLDKELDMKISHGRAREEREECARGEEEVQAGPAPGQTGPHAGQPGPWPGRPAANRKPTGGAYRTRQKPETSQIFGCRPVDRTTTGPRSTARSTGFQTGPVRSIHYVVGASSIIRQPIVRPPARRAAPPVVTATTSRHKKLLGESLPQPPPAEPKGKAAAPLSPIPSPNEDDIDDDGPVDVDAYLNTGADIDDLYMAGADEEAYRARDEPAGPPKATKQRLVFRGFSQETPPAADTQEPTAANIFSPNTLIKKVNEQFEASGAVAPKKPRKRPSKNKEKSASQPPPTIRHRDSMVPPSKDGLTRMHEAGKPILGPELQHLASGDMLPLQDSILVLENILLKDKDPNYPVFAVRVPRDVGFVTDAPADIFFIAYEDIFKLFHSRRLDYNLVRLFALNLAMKIKRESTPDVAIADPYYMRESQLALSAVRVRASLYLQKCFLDNKRKDNILLAYFPEDTYCVLISIAPKYSLATYFDSGSTKKKNYARIRGVLDDALEGYFKKGGAFKEKAECFRDDGKHKFKHVFEFPCVKQPENSTLEAFYVMHHLKGFVRDSQNLRLPSALRGWAEKLARINDDDLREDFHDTKVKLSHIIIQDVITGGGPLNQGRALCKRDIEHRLKAQGDTRTWITKDLYKPFPEPCEP